MSKFVEHDEEAAPGIPEPLPPGERVLWQGSPDWRVLARSKFHLRKLVLYFAAIITALVILSVSRGTPAAEVVAAGVGYSLLASVGLGLVALMAWLNARAAMFTITSKRIILRCGVAIPLSMSLPHTKIDNADIRELGMGFGDIAVTPAVDSSASYVLLWPYARPWHFLRVQPVLRAIKDADRTAEILARAIEMDTQERASRVEIPAEQLPEVPVATDEPKRWQPYPTVPLAAAASLIVIALVATAWVSLSGNRPATYVTDEVVMSVDLLFVDQEDGSLQVLDASSGSTLGTLAPDADGFLRSTLRAMARARRAAGEDVDAAYSIKQTSDKRLLLVDTVTDQRVDLWAFGPTNAAAFARFLPQLAAASEEGGQSQGLSADDAAITAVAHTNQETAQ